jgi:hypothetical protein
LEPHPKARFITSEFRRSWNRGNAVRSFDLSWLEASQKHDA